MTADLTLTDPATERAGAMSFTALAAELDAARRRSLELCDLPDADLVAQHSPLMSPLVWDLAHVANYEDLWLRGNLDGRERLRTGIDDVYDAFRHARADRPGLDLLDPAGARRYGRAVRAEVLAILDDRMGSGGEGAARAAFLAAMVAQHEQQHAETMMATRQLMGERASAPGALVVEASPGVTTAERAVAAGEVVVDPTGFVMGTDDDTVTLDNERPAHAVELAPFAIDRTPVTNAAFARFVEDGGYGDPRHWSTAGWRWRGEAELVAPQFWAHDEREVWTVLRFGRRIALDPHEPVQHVCWFEADAYARWAGKRLPTEAEWECAAAWDPVGRRSRRYPWGDHDPTPELARLAFDERHLGDVVPVAGPAPVGSHPRGAAASGCVDMVGGVWEWTSSDFGGYPGFEVDPYPEYSAVFFGDDHKVLRGGSWATHPFAVRTTFRNWDLPIRRQIFAGFRCARSLGPAATTTRGDRRDR
ncbi:MAG: ergothioneine biosynthesis protein EgtB [Actinomycetota bacterium]|nr:ergothioneine biosynthesis protein EgtB [Actinomycetota bacterium]